jgi:DNA repair protein RadD
MIELRPYQQDAIDSVLNYWDQGGGNPLVDMATGLGKSVVIAKLTRDLLSQYPDMRVLMLVHVRELVQQNFMALHRLWPEARAGIFSAGLNRRDTHRPILFASIQSVHRQDTNSLGTYDLILIDEAHLVPRGGDGMYRKFIEKMANQVPDLRVAGFTATPFRMDSGRIDDGGLFDEAVYSYGIRQGIEDGWLSPLISKKTVLEIDVSGVAKRGGEFVAGALEAATDVAEITKAAVSEMVVLGADRKSWLAFCTGVNHAHNVRDAIRAAGVSCETITGDTPSHDRTRFIADFKAGRIRCLTNANVLTTGFDAPGVDLIAMLRPTLSTGLYVQMIGRGTRKSAGKDNCLVLDFAGVVRRHGPVDTVEVGHKKGPKSDAGVSVETVRSKVCPECESLAALNASECKDCGHVWPVLAKPKHEANADGENAIISTERAAFTPDEQPVVSWSPYRHAKLGSPDSLRVSYLAGLMSYPEWWCFEHDGGARRKAERLWVEHGGELPVPETVTDALERWGELTAPEIILTRKNGQWFDILGRRFASEKERAA